MLRIVSAIISPEVIGATLSGSDNAHIVFILMPLQYQSTPPGFEARSITRQFSFKEDSFFSSNITAGTVLNKISNFGKWLSSSLICIASQP